MRLLRRKDTSIGTALADPSALTDEFEGTTDELFGEIRRLTEASREQRDRDAKRRLVYLRHQAGIRLLDEGDRQPEHPAPDNEALPAADLLPEISPEQLTPGLLRAGILRDGCVVVRGLVSRDDALAFATQID